MSLFEFILFETLCASYQRRQWHPTQLSDFTFTLHFHALEKEMATHSTILAWRIPGMGAWWAAVYGVAQSRTQLTWLSSSSSSASYTWISASFLNFGKFTAIISSNTFSIPFSLSSPSGTSIKHRLAYFILFHRFCMLLSFSHLSFCLLFWLGYLQYSILHSWASLVLSSKESACQFRRCKF